MEKINIVKKVTGNVKFIKILISALLTAATVALLAFSVSAYENADARTAPGGKVSNTDELIAALGGEKCAKAGDGYVTIVWDIELESTVEIISGEFTIYGAGNIVSARSGDFPMISVSGDASLTLGEIDEFGSDASIDFVGSENATAPVIKMSDSSSLTVYNGIRIRDNKSSADGGAIAGKCKSITLNGGELCDNSAVNGGCIAISAGELTVNDGEIFRNNAVNGGAIYQADGSVCRIYGGKIGGEYDSDAIEIDYTKVINGNTAENGGAIYLEGGAELYTEGGKFYSNTASGDGGAFYVSDNARVLLASSEISFNIANRGGCVYNAGDTSTNEIKMSGSDAKKCGGAIYNDGDLHLLSGSISVCHSGTGGGGGIYNAGYLEFISISVYDNKTDGFGGGVYNTGKFDFCGGSVSRNSSTTSTFTKGVLNDGEINMAGTAYVGAENTIALVVTDGRVTPINIVAEFCGGETMALIETVKKNTDSDGRIYFTQTGDSDFELLTGDEALVSGAAKYLKFSEYKNIVRTVEADGSVSGKRTVNTVLVTIAAGGTVMIIAVTVLSVVLLKKKKSK